LNNFATPLFSILFLAFSTHPLYASDWSLSFGANDMIVEGARPLEQAPNGSTSHTFGVQLGIYGRSDPASEVIQRGFFKVFADKDNDKLDPDHIPIWFMAGYQIKSHLSSITSKTSLHALLDLDYKGNTVSSVERQSKIFAGVRAKYTADVFSAGLKTTAGAYSLEIDDDVSKTRGYGRDDYKIITTGFSISADTLFTIYPALTLNLQAQTWQSADEWLENQYTLQLDYNANDWVAGSTFVFSIKHTEYNLDRYNNADPSTPGFLTILPWNKDTLVQAYFVIPWNL